MLLMRVGDPLTEFPVVSTDGGAGWFDARPVTPDYDPAFFGGGGLDRLREAAASGGLRPVDTAGLRVGPPISRPQAILCIGQNYAAHAAEQGSPAPTEPIVFLKHPNTLRGPEDAVRVPIGGEKVDWEVELGVVIGREARYLDTREEALPCVAGCAAFLIAGRRRALKRRRERRHSRLPRSRRTLESRPVTPNTAGAGSRELGLVALPAEDERHRQ